MEVRLIKIQQGKLNNWAGSTNGRDKNIYNIVVD
jgi:hypothetical protein